MKFKKVFWGLFFILAAGVFMANSLELFGTHISFMKLLLTIGLSAIVIGSFMSFSFFGIIMPLAGIAVVFGTELGITNITPWPLLITAFLISVGLEIIFSSNRIKFGVHINDKEEIIDIEDEDNVSHTVSFGSAVKYVNTNNLKTCNLEASFGSLVVYFDNAKVSPDGAVIKLDVSFAGAELYIPKEWNVVIESSAVFGGIDERKNKTPKEGPKVVIKGNVSFAGVEIIYI